MIGERIRNRRKELRLTQAQLAEYVGISRVSLTKIENSDTANMSVNTAINLAKTLGLSLDYLLCGKC